MSTLNRRQFLAASAIASTAPMIAQAQTPKTKYRACVIGNYADGKNGGYGHNLHLLWNMRDDVEVVALSEPHEKARGHYAKQAKAQKTYVDYCEMLEKEKPDIVTIGPRWTTIHKEYLLACVEAGAHGIIEKPLTPDLAEADEVLAALDAKKLKWAAALNFRVAPMFQHAKKLLLDDKVIGDILEIRSRGKEDNRAGGEDLIVLGVHIMDMMIDLLGKPQWCEATVLADGKPVTAANLREASEPLGPIVGTEIHAKYLFANGIPGYFSSVKTNDGNQDRWGLDIHGTKGRMTIRMAPVPIIHVQKDGSWASSDAPWGKLSLPPLPNREGKVNHYAPIVDDLIESIKAEREPLTSLHKLRDAHEMIQGVFQAAVTQQRVAIPLKQRVHPLSTWK